MPDSPERKSRQAAAIIACFLFLLGSLLFQREESGGGMCRKNLAGANPGDHAMVEATSYGAPVRFLTVRSEGCFEERQTRLEWFWPGLALDLLAVVVVGALLDWCIRAVQRLISKKA